jgi:glycosyltransferase involved in cell wall biosynthesis
MPYFSIVIPTYNRAHLITKTLDSIKAQTFRDFEVLIIDDGSTDNTESVVKP